MKKATLNYWVDALTGFAFFVCSVSGLVFLVPISADSLLGVSFQLWDVLHTYSALITIGGVGLHFFLHWDWIAAMTKKQFAGAPVAAPARVQVASRESVPAAAPTGGITRRQFLVTSGCATAAVICGAGALSLANRIDKAETQALSTATAQPVTPTTAAPTQLSVSEPAATDTPAPVVVEPTATAVPTAEATQAVSRARGRCPKGLVNDPFPGRCRRYTDLDGDGICDYSQG
jgi:hypothetical protein